MFVKSISRLAGKIKEIIGFGKRMHKKGRGKFIFWFLGIACPLVVSLCLYTASL